MQEIDVLFELSEECVKTINDEIPTINQGGCGIFAEKLYNILDKMGLNPTVVFITRYTGDWREWLGYDLNDKGVSIRNGMLDPFCHVMVKVDGYYLDSSGIYDRLAEHPMNCVVGSSFTPEFDLGIEALRDILKLDIWNDNYKKSNTRENKIW